MTPLFIIQKKFLNFLIFCKKNTVAFVYRKKLLILLALKSNFN